MRGAGSFPPPGRVHRRSRTGTPGCARGANALGARRSQLVELAVSGTIVEALLRHFGSQGGNELLSTFFGDRVYGEPTTFQNVRLVAVGAKTRPAHVSDDSEIQCAVRIKAEGNKNR